MNISLLILCLFLALDVPIYMLAVGMSAEAPPPWGMVPGSSYVLLCRVLQQKRKK